ncbi:hypothetical protein N7492_003156 [Penicillium capsulatum]|uniref:Nudix hydrolase domain-containing protein n=1 Tax=Penicillium capsulatum TaxID=69766 RepID=A0A9W9IMM3_9EURO|nr:hypothetical protein N7492_003156 [Penicillium capsulatum]KAJ6122254.1 hypothetical protein N7512_004719 [Penicillium capsulatum]
MSLQHSGNLEQRSVVSSFIFSAAYENIQVALFRRSDQVHTYRHRLAPISGSIDNNESPVAAAWREIEEETALTPRELKLWRQGKPFSYSDPDIGREWVIHPFAFQLKSLKRKEPEFQINWEHDGWEWHDPGSIRDGEQLGGVPRLAESLRRVWFEVAMNQEAGRTLHSALEQLRSDHHSGSHELTSIALKEFRDVLAALQGDENWWNTARMAAWHLWKNGRESMGAATLNAILGVLADIEALQVRNLDFQSRWNGVIDVVDQHLKQRRAMPSQIKTTFANYLQRNFQSDSLTQSPDTLTILTLSASSTIRDSILDTFASLPLSRLDLRILESRPLFEGASMASSIFSEWETKHLSSFNKELHLTVYTDASAALASSNVDFVLLGADRISSSGSISNKTGSLPAVLTAKYISPKAKILIFSQLEKVSAPGTEDDDRPEQNERVEIMSGWFDADVKGLNVLVEAIEGRQPENSNYRVDAKNVYFEWVPADLIDAYISQDGTLDKAKILGKAQHVQQQTQRYFDSL